jgi:glycosyltransferase involved in cell wall biosynthesis
VQQLERFYDGSYLQHLRERMSPEVGERITFVGRIPHAETRRYYSSADLFVYPSIFESFAIPPVEAMAAGVPVIASRIGGMQETVVHERTGLFVEREDPDALAAAIKRVIDDRELRRSLGEAGPARAAELFSWEAIASDVETTFERLVAR